MIIYIYIYTYMYTHIYIERERCTYVYIYGDESLITGCPAEKVEKVSRVVQSNSPQAKLINGQRFARAPTMPRLSPSEPNQERDFLDKRRICFSTSKEVGENAFHLHQVTIWASSQCPDNMPNAPGNEPTLVELRGTKRPYMDMSANPYRAKWTPDMPISAWKARGLPRSKTCSTSGGSLKSD